MRADVRRDTFQGHHSTGARIFRDLRVLRRDHVHYHAAFEHLRQTALNRFRSGMAVIALSIGGHVIPSFGSSVRTILA
jgi:hypothetical protein